jgi:hypothetical protein
MRRRYQISRAALRQMLRRTRARPPGPLRVKTCPAQSAVQRQRSRSGPVFAAVRWATQLNLGLMRALHHRTETPSAGNNPRHEGQDVVTRHFGLVLKRDVVNDQAAVPFCHANARAREQLA